MLCSLGTGRTITVADDNKVYAFGSNELGQLGVGKERFITIPTPIVNLPKIQKVSCGYWFTICIDFDGFMWSFGDNMYGQLGTGDKKHYNTPQKISKIPPVKTVAWIKSCIANNKG